MEHLTMSNVGTVLHKPLLVDVDLNTQQPPPSLHHFQYKHLNVNTK